jgi:hypothetical protein
MARATSSYLVAKMAGVNKFLRIYYARAMELYR